MFFALLGIATALFNMQIISMVTINYGVMVAFCAVAYSCVVSAVFGRVLASNAIRSGFGLNLFARRLFGFRGASIFSFAFGLVSLVFFGAEAGIMAASAMSMAPAVPVWVAMPAAAMIMVPLVWFGVKALARLQLATLVLYVGLLVVAFVVSAHKGGGVQALSVLPQGGHPSSATIGVLTALGVMNGPIFSTILVITDYARYIRRSQIRAGEWWVGAIFPLCSFGLSGFCGMWFATRYMEQNPGVYFVTMLGLWGALFAILTQLRINLANMYSGSLAFVNMLYQAFDIKLSRHVVILLFGATASVGLLLGLMEHLMMAMNVIGMFLLCFCVLLVVDLMARPVPIEGTGHAGYEAGAIPDWSLPAIVSTLAATFVGVLLMNGAAGQDAAKWASFVAGGSVLPLYFAAAGLGRLKRRPARPAA